MDTAEALLREAEEQIETWWCELDRRWDAVLDQAHDEASAIVADAEAHAAELRREAEAELDRVRALASEHVEAARALAAAEAVVARGLDPDDLAGLRQAVDRLRAELSRVVDAAFDAMPAMEATAAAVDQVLATEVPEDGELVGAAPAAGRPRRGLLRRLLGR